MILHDLAKTYGIKNYFIVTPLIDQQKIVRKLLDFWQAGEGIEYNASRHDAVKHVELMASLNDVIAAIEKKEGKKPLLVTTSARASMHNEQITFFDQGKVWQKQQPVLLIFGTGQGLSAEIVEKSDFLLVPVEGLSDYNHLSVRSAVAIVLDRWLGLNRKR